MKSIAGNVKKGEGKKKKNTTLTKSGLCWLHDAATLKGLWTTNRNVTTAESRACSNPASC